MLLYVLTLNTRSASKGETAPLPASVGKPFSSSPAGGDWGSSRGRAWCRPAVHPLLGPARRDPDLAAQGLALGQLCPLAPRSSQGRRSGQGPRGPTRHLMGRPEADGNSRGLGLVRLPLGPLCWPRLPTLPPPLSHSWELSSILSCSFLHTVLFFFFNIF